LQIQIPAAVGHVVGMADAVPELWTAAANFTNSCHKTEISRAIESLSISVILDPSQSAPPIRHVGRLFACERLRNAAVESQTLTILVVDDSETIRKLVGAILSQDGYRIIEAADGADALRVMDGRLTDLDLVITDVMMPNMGGPELARRIGRSRPELRMIFISGYLDDLDLRAIESMPAMFLPKPFTAVGLLESVRTALQRPCDGLPEGVHGSAGAP
jgi:CheY-like chemotaxis protein